MAQDKQKVRVGRVVSGKMDQTVVVAIRWQRRHRIYKKNIRRVTKLYAHDKDNRCQLGDMVRIQETRPISRTKRWRVIEIVERLDLADVKPIDLEESILSEELAEETPEEQGILSEELDEEISEDAEDV